MKRTSNETMRRLIALPACLASFLRTPILARKNVRILRFAALGLASSVLATAARAQVPRTPASPWSPPASLHLQAPAEGENTPHFDAAQPLTLAALIDIAEQRNPETRSAWEQARRQAAAEGVARAALFPTLTGLVLSQTTRNGILFNSAFVRQTVGTFAPALQLEYTVFDFNERIDALRASRYDLFATNFAFNNTHLSVIYSVTEGYFDLLNSMGLVAAAQANLRNAQTVAQQVDARLANGLATLPDALEARAAAAQAQYELSSLQGSQSNAQAHLATMLRLPANTLLPVVPLQQLTPPTQIADTAADATARALANRPDLLQQEARIRAADERIHAARTAYLPSVSFSGVLERARMYGQQDILPSTYDSLGQWNAQLNLKWTLFDGGLRHSEVAEATAEKRSAEAELDAQRDTIEDQVWTAYTDTQTAFTQQASAEALLGAAQASYSAATEAYGDGVRTLVDVVTAERALAEARSEEVTARTGLFKQMATLAFRTADLLASHNGPATLPAAAPATAAPQTPSGTPATTQPNQSATGGKTE